MLSEAQIEKERERQEILNYGRYWVWEGYFNPKNRDRWVAAAEKLKHINPHVIQDIEDYLLLEGLKGHKDIKKIIELDQHSRRTKVKNKPKDQEEVEKVQD